LKRGEGGLKEVLWEGGGIIRAEGGEGKSGRGKVGSGRGSPPFIEREERSERFTGLGGGFVTLDSGALTSSGKQALFLEREAGYKHSEILICESGHVL